MGILFPDSDEYPDYQPMPPFTARIDGAVVPLAIAGTLVGLCPVLLEEHGQGHPLHEDYRPVSYRVPALAVSTTSGNVTVAPSTGSLGLAGHAPTVVIRSSSSY